MTTIPNRDAPIYLLRKCKFIAHSKLSGLQFKFEVKHGKYLDTYDIFYDYKARKIFIGTYIRPDGYLYISKYEVNNGRISSRARVANIIFKNLYKLDELEWLTLSVESSCKYCGRKLHDIKSLRLGYGPECAKKHNPKQLQMEVLDA